MKLTKENCEVSQTKSSNNLYITHPKFKIKLRFYADIEELQKDANWRERVVIRAGTDSYYAVLAKEAMVPLDL